jgi:hypothetical protein
VTAVQRRQQPDTMFSSCDEAESKFKSVGCSCFTCDESNGNVEASCTSPYSCSLQVLQSTTDTSDTPEMGAKEYGVVFAVYIVTALVLAGSAIAISFYCFRNKVKEEPTVKEILAKRMHVVVRLVYMGSLASFVQDDGSPMGFVDYFCDKKELFGLLDWRKKTAKVRPRWMRGCAIVTTLLVTISLAFLLGTVVYNNESCATTHSVNFSCDCQTLCGGVDMGCDACECKSSSECYSSSYQCQSSTASADAAQSTSSFTCESASVETSRTANWVTAILTRVMAKAGSQAIGTADAGSTRQKFLFLATAIVSIFLIAFSAVFSEHLKKGATEGDDGANARRLQAVGQTLFTGWWYDQVVGFGAIISRFVCSWGAYMLYQPKLKEVKRGDAAAVHPQSAQGFDDSIMKTEGVKGGIGYPVRIDKVKLEVLTQQQ